MDLIVGVLKLTWDLAVTTVEAGFWIAHGTSRTVEIGVDAVRARRSMRGGVLHCLRGHPIDVAEATWECTDCHFLWDGDPWICRNPECEAPQTVFVNCPTCGRSQRSPFRWGSP